MYLAVAGVVLTVYRLTLLPGIGYFGDTAKFQFVGKVLGIPHATGYPTYVVLNHLFVTLFPFGSSAAKANLLSAVFAAGAIVLLTALLRRLGVRTTVACATALAFAFTPGLWSQSVIAEVYTLHLLFVAAIVYLLVAWSEGAITGSPVPGRRHPGRRLRQPPDHRDAGAGGAVHRPRQPWPGRQPHDRDLRRGRCRRRRFPVPLPDRPGPDGGGLSRARAHGREGTLVRRERSAVQAPHVPVHPGRAAHRADPAVSRLHVERHVASCRRRRRRARGGAHPFAHHRVPRCPRHRQRRLGAQLRHSRHRRCTCCPRTW